MPDGQPRSCSATTARSRPTRSSAADGPCARGQRRRPRVPRPRSDAHRDGPTPTPPAVAARARRRSWSRCSVRRAPYASRRRRPPRALRMDPPTAPGSPARSCSPGVVGGRSSTVTGLAGLMIRPSRDVAEALGDDGGDAVAAHRDAVERVGDLHRALLVRDDDQLAGFAQLLEDRDAAGRGWCRRARPRPRP